jgi:hypothetical protein
MKSPYEILIPDQTRQRFADYKGELACGAAAPGKRLAAQLQGNDDYLTALLRTKLPQIFAESITSANLTSL